MSKVFLTGGTGLIGRYIALQLIESGHTVTGLCRTLPESEAKLEWIEGDVTDPLALQEAMRGADAVVHAAAVVSFHPGQEKEMEAINVGGTRNVVNACLKLGVGRMVHMSSVSALGRYPGVDVIDEQAPWHGGSSAYGKSKYKAEQEVYRGQEEGLQIAIVNPSVVLAPGAFHRSTGRLFKYSLDGRPFYTDGLAGIVDVRDVARFINLLVDGAGTGQRYLLNAGMIPWRDLFRELSIRFGTRPPWIRIPPGALTVAAWLENFRAIITGQEPLITAEAVRLASEPHRYNASRSEGVEGFRYTGLQETFDWVCSEIRKDLRLA